MSLFGEDEGEQDDKNRGDVREVFEYWRLKIGTPRSRLDATRTRKIRMRFKDGYTVEELKNAIDGCSWSAWHMGQNDRHRPFNDIEYICRDAVHVDEFLEEFRKQKRRRDQSEVIRKQKEVDDKKVTEDREERMKRIAKGHKLVPPWHRKPKGE